MVAESEFVTSSRKLIPQQNLKKEKKKQIRVNIICRATLNFRPYKVTIGSVFPGDYNWKSCRMVCNLIRNFNITVAHYCLPLADYFNSIHIFTYVFNFALIIFQVFYDDQYLIF